MVKDKDSFSRMTGTFHSCWSVGLNYIEYQSPTMGRRLAVWYHINNVPGLLSSTSTVNNDCNYFLFTPVVFFIYLSIRYATLHKTIRSMY